VTGIAVEVERTPAGLALRYVLSGDLAALAVPPRAPSRRTDELWRHTCFEAFVRPLPGAAYREFNLAPSTQWAAYRFAAYREGMEPAGTPPPRVEVEAGAGRLTLHATLAVPDPGRWRLGLSAVVETTEGRVSYWALRHPPGRPDFHHGDCFALELPESARP
jgi:hypothetical protein